LIVAMVATTWGSFARAEAKDDPSFWGKVSGKKQSKDPKGALQEVIKLLRKAHREKDPAKKKKLTLRAAKAARLGIDAHPKNGDLRYWLGYALYNLKRYKESLASLSKARKLEPKHLYMADIGFKQGIIYTVLGDFPKAIKAYELALDNTTESDIKGVIYANTAECLMASGKIRQAILFYQRSLEAKPGSNSQALWGLAVALDRDQQITRAYQAARAAYRLDPKLEHIKGPSVFFVPKGEKHYYLGLAYEVAGHLDRSLKHWRSYIKALPKSPWLHRAKSHERRVLSLRAKATPMVRRNRKSKITINRDEIDRSKSNKLLSFVRPTMLRCYKRVFSRKSMPTGLVKLVLDASSRYRIGKVHVDPKSDPGLKTPAFRKCLRARLDGRRLPFAGRARTNNVHVELFLDVYLKL
jgi:tetratricopeptide (TPR) repeat protein